MRKGRDGGEKKRCDGEGVGGVGGHFLVICMLIFKYKVMFMLICRDKLGLRRAMQLKIATKWLGFVYSIIVHSG